MPAGRAVGHGLPFKKIQALLRTMHGVTISVGALVDLYRRDAVRVQVPSD